MLVCQYKSLSASACVGGGCACVWILCVFVGVCVMLADVAFSWMIGPTELNVTKRNKRSQATQNKTRKSSSQTLCNIHSVYNTTTHHDVLSWPLSSSFPPPLCGSGPKSRHAALDPSSKRCFRGFVPFSISFGLSISCFPGMFLHGLSDIYAQGPPYPTFRPGTPYSWWRGGGGEGRRACAFVGLLVVFLRKVVWYVFLEPLQEVVWLSFSSSFFSFCNLQFAPHFKHSYPSSCPEDETNFRGESWCGRPCGLSTVNFSRGETCNTDENMIRCLWFKNVPWHFGQSTDKSKLKHKYVYYQFIKKDMCICKRVVRQILMVTKAVTQMQNESHKTKIFVTIAYFVP